jgi:hypothetical protein
MKYIVLILVCLASAMANAYGPVRVTGQGKSFEEAKQNALTQAIETISGSIVVNQREHRDGTTTKNNTIVHSAGYVTEYKIIDRYTSRSFIYVEMDVYVNPSNLADKVLTKMPEPQMVDGYNANASYETAVESRNSWSNIVQTIMDDYPNRAYNVDQGKAYTKLSYENSMILNVPYRLSWNKNYLNSFEEMISHSSNGRVGFFNTSNQNAVFVIGSNSYSMDRRNSIQLQKTMLNNKIPQLLVTLRASNGSIIGKACVKIEGSNTMMYSFGNANYMSIFGRNVFQGQVSLELGRLPEDYFDIELEVYGRQECMALANSRV